MTCLHLRHRRRAGGHPPRAAAHGRPQRQQVPAHCGACCTAAGRQGSDLESEAVCARGQDSSAQHIGVAWQAAHQAQPGHDQRHVLHLEHMRLQGICDVLHRNVPGAKAQAGHQGRCILLQHLCRQQVQKVAAGASWFAPWNKWTQSASRDEEKEPAVHSGAHALPACSLVQATDGTRSTASSEQGPVTGSRGSSAEAVPLCCAGLPPLLCMLSSCDRIAQPLPCLT